MTRPAFIVAAVLAGAPCALAQSPLVPPPPQNTAAPAAASEQAQPPAAVAASPAAPAASPAAAPPASAGPSAAAVTPEPMTRERMQRIYHIRQLEGMFTNAVKAGAGSVANQLQFEPNSLFVNGNARARGFELEGYGIFFDVDVPTMMQSAVWAMQEVRQQQQYVNSLARALADPTLDPNTRRVAESEMGRMQRAMNRGLLAPIPAQPVPAPAGQPAQGVAVAQTTDSAVPVANAAPAPAARPLDPNELYTETIKGALIDAMLSYGSALHIADGEWLTVAARATSQSAPGVLDDSSSIVLRIKGSDLTAFLTGKITRDEAIKRIETKES